MPHVIVKLYAGRSEEQKQDLAAAIAKNVVEITECKEASVSVAIEEFEPVDWPEKVYRPDIMDKKQTLYKTPGYDPFTEKDNETEKSTPLMEQVRGAAEQAKKEDTSGHFDAMSWLDLALEDTPEFFDSFFDTPWVELLDAERGKRIVAIRSVL